MTYLQAWKNICMTIFWNTTICQQLSDHINAFSALAVLVGHQEEHPACKN